MIECIGLASGEGAGNRDCSEGPLFLKNNLNIKCLNWRKIVTPQNKTQDKYDLLANLNEELAKESFELSKKGSFFFSFGGDHSSAIGTWSGVAAEKKEKNQEIGLIWIDAHMDSHIPSTSPSGNIHGMPLAALLGYGDSRLTHVLSKSAKIKPENLVLIGIRSFEKEEEIFLKKLNVKIYYIEEVLRKGFKNILEETIADLAKKTACYGVSFDLDVIDPKHVNAVGTPVPNGIKAEDAIEAMDVLKKHFPIAFEIVEYNPKLDEDKKTLKFTEKLIQKLINGECKNDSSNN
ncbi:MAG TPA: arginase [Parachlamydiaceae bacterium]|nr:arginase [Parachlamydiaceae bacterium]